MSRIHQTPLKDHAIERAIFVSLIVHGILLLLAIGIVFPQWQKNKKHRAQVEISYKQMNKKPVNVNEHPIKPAQQLDLVPDTAQHASDKRMQAPLSKTKTPFPAGLRVDRKAENWRSLSSVKHKITITPISSQKINNPAYAAYSEIVRSRIHESVYANYDPREVGRVYLTFIVDKSGALRIYKIIADKTIASQHLQDIALKSLKQASPFPLFLKGMTLPEYTFNIEIQYQAAD